MDLANFGGTRLPVMVLVEIKIDERQNKGVIESTPRNT
jgi:hypothetical protein